MAAAVYVGTYHKVRLIAPFQYMSKGDIVKLGLRIDVPYGLTWSCYEGRELACGDCPTCVERLHAFHVNGVKDPLHYR
jgi:7-cyano-7-deazaguanine synthase